MKSYDKLTDNELVVLARDGDALAESTLVKRYASLAEAVSRSYFLTGGDEEDLYQIALIALLEATRTYDASRGAEFKTYASACMRNRILDAVRSAGAFKNAPLNNSLRIEDDEARDGGLAVVDIASPDLSPEQQYIAKEAEEAFFDALSGVLGERDLAVIRLYLASVPYKEISSKLGISQKKVDNTLYNAKKKIARMMERLRGGE